MLGEGGQGRGEGLLVALSGYISDSPLGSEGWGPCTSRPCLPPALDHATMYPAFKSSQGPLPPPPLLALLSPQARFKPGAPSTSLQPVGDPGRENPWNRVPSGDG